MSKRILWLTVWIISLSLSVGAGKTILDFLKRSDIVGEREKELARVKQENTTLQQKLIEIRGETYVERIARDQLGLVKSGETIVMLPEQGRDQSDKTAETLPNWRKWWRLFF